MRMRSFTFVILFLFSVFSLWLIGRRVSIFDGDIVIDNIPYVWYRDAVYPICDSIPSETTPKINMENMKYSVDNVDYLDQKSLEDFCQPYVYTKFNLKLGKKETGDCAPESKIRGSNCTWYHMCVWPGDEDIHISHAIIRGGVWEEEMVRYAIGILKDKPTGIVIDAGANIGQYSLVAALLKHQVYAFEPVPQHVDMIIRSAALNGIRNRIVLFRNGLADYNAKTHINFHVDNKGGSTIDKIGSKEDETKTDSIRFFERIEIDLITLDDTLSIMSKLHNDLDIIYWKADIEGYEPRMFRGAYKFIGAKKPPLIVFEILGKSFNRTKCHLHHLFYALMDIGYNIKTFKGGKKIDFEDVYELSKSIVEKKEHKDIILEYNSTISIRK